MLCFIITLRLRVLRQAPQAALPPQENCPTSITILLACWNCEVDSERVFES